MNAQLPSERKDAKDKVMSHPTAIESSNTLQASGIARWTRDETDFTGTATVIWDSRIPRWKIRLEIGVIEQRDHQLITMDIDARSQNEIIDGTYFNADPGVDHAYFEFAGGGTHIQVPTRGFQVTLDWQQNRLLGSFDGEIYVPLGSTKIKLRGEFSASRFQAIAGLDDALA
jgi:outer membrane biogenesis lipoprotein LolB